MNESHFSQSLNFSQGKSLHSAQVSYLFFLIQHVMIEQEGCLLKKSRPQHPGHFDGPLV